MTRKTNSGNNGRISSGQRSSIRIALATGATLAMLISAQLFASESSTSATTQTTAQVAAALTTVPIATVAPTTTTDRDETVDSTESDSAIFSTESQPVPHTHSSK